MAVIIGGVGTSHIPAIGAALDTGRADSEAWKSIIDGYAPVQQWIMDTRPDTAIVIYNDHGNAFGLDLLPTFAIGAAAQYLPADEGYGRRKIPTITGDAELSWHLIEQLVAEGFDPAVCQRLDVDHGLTVPMSLLWGAPDQWPVKIVPIAVNVIQYPLPTALRCYQLGQALRLGIESYSGDSRVLVVGTGGMSHQLQGQRVGYINSEFDEFFLDRMTRQPEYLTQLSTSEYIRLAGSEGAELIMWLVMRGALGTFVAERYRSYHVPASNSAAGVIVLQGEE